MARTIVAFSGMRSRVSAEGKRGSVPYRHMVSGLYHPDTDLRTSVKCCIVRGFGKVYMRLRERQSLYSAQPPIARAARLVTGDA